MMANGALNFWNKNLKKDFPVGSYVKSKTYPYLEGEVIRYAKGKMGTLCLVCRHKGETIRISAGSAVLKEHWEI